MKLFRRFPGRKVDDYQPWFYLIECGIKRSRKCIEFYLDLFPYTGEVNNFHFRWNFEIDWGRGLIHNFICWQ